MTQHMNQYDLEDAFELWCDMDQFTKLPNIPHDFASDSRRALFLFETALRQTQIDDAVTLLLKFSGSSDFGFVISYLKGRLQDKFSLEDTPANKSTIASFYNDDIAAFYAPVSKPVLKASVSTEQAVLNAAAPISTEPALGAPVSKPRLDAPLSKMLKPVSPVLTRLMHQPISISPPPSLEPHSPVISSGISSMTMSAPPTAAPSRSTSIRSTSNISGLALARPAAYYLMHTYKDRTMDNGTKERPSDFVLMIQKTLYFSDALSLKRNGQAIFQVQPRRRQNGPMYKEVQAYITKFKTRDDIPTEPANIAPDVKALLDAVVKSVGSLSAEDLVQYSHEEEPWKCVKEDEVITHDSMYQAAVKGSKVLAQIDHGDILPPFDASSSMVTSNVYSR